MRTFACLLAVLLLVLCASVADAGGFGQVGFSPNGVLIVNNNNNARMVAPAVANVAIEQRGGLFGRRVQRVNAQVPVSGFSAGGSVVAERRGPFGRVRARTEVRLP